MLNFYGWWLPSLKIVINLPRTYEKLCKGKQYRFRGQKDLSVQTDRQTHRYPKTTYTVFYLIYVFLHKLICQVLLLSQTNTNIRFEVLLKNQ